MSTLKGKTVLVTGASGGLGAEIAREFANAGASLVIHYAGRREPAQELADSITKSGGEAFVLQADVTKSDEVKKLYDDAIAHYGKIDVVVNSAGVMITKLLKDTTDEDFIVQFDTNVKGTFFSMREAMAKMADNGVIINISTTINRLMVPTYGTYTAAKSAVEQLSRVASKEVGRGIRINSVSPGPVDTPLYRNGKTAEMIARQAAQNPWNRIGEPKDIAPVVVFMASDEAHWISGQNLGINGALA